MTRVQLKSLIRETIERQLQEMPRIATMIKIEDPQKAEEAKKQFKGTWLEKLINVVQNSGNTGITQPELALAVGKARQQDINGWVRKFMADGIIVLGQSAQPIKQRPEPGGPKGRPFAQKTLIVQALYDKFKGDPNYQPSSEETVSLTPEEIEKVKARATGTIKLGRKFQGPKEDPNEDDSDIINNM